MREDCLLTSPLEYTNEEYAIAKIAGLKMCESYNLQYGTNYIAVMPTNLYGPNDNFHLENSHVMPAMMRKIYLAKLIHDGEWDKIAIDLNKRPVEGVTGEGLTENSTLSTDSKLSTLNSKRESALSVLAKYGIYNNKVVLWGTGKPLREFLWSEDMADASAYVLLNVNFSDTYDPQSTEIRNCHINIGSGKELTIRELATKVVEATGFKGELRWDATKPDGTPRKLTDVSKIHRLGWHHKVEIDEGVRRLRQWYINDQNR
jgi:GDP-L-fucose synthase